MASFLPPSRDRGRNLRKKMKTSAKKQNVKPAQPRKRRVRGRGDYTDAIKSIPNIGERVEAKIDHLEKALVHATPTASRAASTIGRTLGNFLNQGDLGALAGEGLSKLFGFGDYSIKSNTLVTSLKSNAQNSIVPKFSAAGKRGTKIVEREMIGTVSAGALVSGATIFNNVSLAINPANELCFPWLSTIASQFDQWEPNGIIFEFVSTSSDFNGASQALGTVIMATDYDPYDSTYTSKVQMENSDYACATKPSNSLVHGIECDVHERPTPILYTNVTNNTAIPISQTTLGNFQIATQGCSVANVTLGELWVSYDITFYKKQLTPNFGPSWYGSGVTANTLGIFGGQLLNPFSSQITLTPNVGVGTVINFNNSITGTYFLLTFYYALVNVSDTFGAWTAVGCTVNNSRYSNNGTSAVGQWLVTTNNPYATYTTTLAHGTSAWELAIVQIPTIYF
jgi:hypothetical protein